MTRPVPEKEAGTVSGFQSEAEAGLTSWPASTRSLPARRSAARSCTRTAGSPSRSPAASLILSDFSNDGKATGNSWLGARLQSVRSPVCGPIKQPGGGGGASGLTSLRFIHTSVTCSSFTAMKSSAGFKRDPNTRARTSGVTCLRLQV